MDNQMAKIHNGQCDGNWDYAEVRVESFEFWVSGFTG